MIITLTTALLETIELSIVKIINISSLIGSQWAIKVHPNVVHSYYLYVNQ